MGSVIILGVLVVALVGVVVQSRRLHQTVVSTPKLEPAIAGSQGFLPDDFSPGQPKISVIIPAYNEAANIEGCLTSVLASTETPAEFLEVWMIDDQSSDHTLEIAQRLQETLADRRLKLLVGEPRPSGERWMGKNWACVQGAQQAKGEYLLFLDADVRLKPGAVATAIHTMQTEQIDLLTICPEVVCGCLAEWLVQPLILTLLAIGFDFVEVNNPASETAFANGQFMLFQRSAYEKLGGHQSVASEVVEDVELARRVKQMGLKLKYALGPNRVSVRMYSSWAAIWEGWTKNWYLGSRRNLSLTLYSAIITVWICTLPWLGLIALTIQAITVGLNWVGWLALGMALVVILFQYRLRQSLYELVGIPPRYWWLTGIGGLLFATIALASIIKTETGWGWTWRGRSLKF